MLQAVEAVYFPPHFHLPDSFQEKCTLALNLHPTMLSIVRKQMHVDSSSPNISKIKSFSQFPSLTQVEKVDDFWD